MPLVSEAQRRWMWANDPELAREFADATPKGTKLPYHKGDKSKPFVTKHDPTEKSASIADLLLLNELQAYILEKDAWVGHWAQSPGPAAAAPPNSPERLRFSGLIRPPTLNDMTPGTPEAAGTVPAPMPPKPGEQQAREAIGRAALRSAGIQNSNPLSPPSLGSLMQSAVKQPI